MGRQLRHPVWVFAFMLMLQVLDARQRRSTARTATKPNSFAAGATQLLRSGRVDEAAAAFDRALAASSTGGDADLHYNRAVAMQSMVPPRLEEAVWSWQMAISREPASTPVDVAAHTHYHLALGLHELDRFAEALEPLRKALALSPDRYALEAGTLECACSYSLAPEQATEKVGFGGSNDDFARELSASYEQALGLCERAIAFEVEEQVSEQATRAFERRGLAMAFHTSYQILGDLNRLSEAQHFMDAALMLTPSHQPIEMAIDHLRSQMHNADAVMPLGTRSRGNLKLLWPTGLDETGKLKQSHLVALKTFPFALVSHVPGSTPPVPPLYTPVWLSTSNDLAIVNRNLVEAVLHMRNEEPRGSVVSNVGGWQSARNFFESASSAQAPWAHADAIRALHVLVLENVKHFTAELGLDATTAHISIRESWANVNQHLDWNEDVCAPPWWGPACAQPVRVCRD